MEKYLDITKIYDENKLKYISHEIKNGKLAIIPTDTVYGIAANGLNEVSIKKVFQIKNRPLTNPINLLVSDINMIESITENITDLEYKLIKTFLPGPFTIILKKKDIIPDIVTNNSNFVGIRIPNDKIALKIINFAEVPLAVPSANISGNLSGTCIDDIFSDFNNDIDYIIDNGDSKIGLESTVVQVIDNIPHILRLGAILPKDIEKVSGSVIISSKDSPSANLKHYNTHTKNILITGNNTKNKVAKIIELSKLYNNVIVVCCDENLDTYLQFQNITPLSFGSISDLNTISKKLFHVLTKADKLTADIIIIESVPEIGIGKIIMDKLFKVSNNNIIEI